MPRFDWTLEEVREIYQEPFPDLIYKAQTIHRQHFEPCKVQRSTLLSIKTGACPEDCAYCSQSSRSQAIVERTPLMQRDEVLAAARSAKDNGSTRFCMGAAWRQVKDGEEFEQVLDMVRAVRALGMSACCTLGMLTLEQARRLKEAGCYAYNHNLDTSPQYYPKIVSTRTYADRLQTLAILRQAGLALCCGGIMGMGESVDDRLELLRQLASLKPHPENVPINMLVSIPGTKLENATLPHPLDFVRIMATARILLPRSSIHLAAGRNIMSDETQALCFLAGATSIFAGDKLLTTPNPGDDRDAELLARLGMQYLSHNDYKEHFLTAKA
jgi:biotin synthase